MLKLKLFVLLSLFTVAGICQTKMNLQQLVEYALTHSTTLQRSIAQSTQNKADYTSSQMKMLPTINSNISNNFNFGRAIDPTTNLFSTERTQANYFSLSSDVLLFGGFQMQNQLRQSKYTMQAGQYALQKTKDDIALMVANYYLQYALLTEKEKQIENNLKSSDALFQKNKILYEAGAIAEVKKLESEAQKAADELTLTDIANQKKSVVRQLKQYINYDITQPLEVDIQIVAINTVQYTEADLQKAIDENYKNLPTIKQAEANLLATKYSVNVAKGGFSPKLFASGSLHTGYSSAALKIGDFKIYGYKPIGFVYPDSSKLVYAPYGNNSTEKRNYLSQITDNFGQSVGVSLSIPVFNGLQSHLNLLTSQINYKAAELNLTEAKNKVRYDIYQSYESVQMLQKKYLAAQARMVLQQALFDKTDASYKAGITSYYDWTQSRNLLTNAQTEVLQAKYEFIFQQKIFDFYLGKPLSF